MFCHKCGREFGNNEIFCPWCGTLKNCEQESVLSSSGDEKLAIEHYFKRGFCYETSVHFRAEYHGISMNVRTLKRRLRHYGLRRTNHLHSEHSVREIIKREIEGPSSLLWYRGMWNKLRTTYYVTVPRDMVMKISESWIPYGSREGTIHKYVANPIKYFKWRYFSQITVEKFAKSKKLLRILRNVVDPQITFSRIWKYFPNPWNYFKSQFLYKSLLKSLANLKNIANPKKLIGFANNF